MKNKEVLQQTSTAPREFPLELLERITDNFSNERIIGRGAYGAVYKGVLDGEEIAVKKLYQQPGLGDDQFNECINLMRVQHQNIVRLIGYCYVTEKKVGEYNGKLVFADQEERALCLEYLQGGSLDAYLSEEMCGLDWPICYRIIKGTCEGLKYLHAGSKNPIYHLDLKPANILLDKDMIPKIGDFGLSRLLGSALTCVTEKPIGTLGYMPPEYIDKHIITSKFDVFSLGIIILQIMAGRTGCSQRADMPSNQFIDLVQGNWEKRLEATMSSDRSWEVKTCIELALTCVEDDRVHRPTIVEIVDKLNKIDTTESLSTGQVIDFGRQQDSKERFTTIECGAAPSSSSSIDVNAVPLHRPPRNGRFFTLCTNHRTQGRIPWSLIPIAITSTVSLIVAVVVLVLFFAVVPKVNANITDARLTIFGLSTTQTLNMTSLLAYNMSVAISVHNTNKAMTITYITPLVATIFFYNQSLYDETVTKEGQNHPPNRTKMYQLQPAVGEKVLDVAAVEEFMKQNATGVFTGEVRLSGGIKFGMGNTRNLRLTCPLSLQLTTQGTVANCVHL